MDMRQEKKVPMGIGKSIAYVAGLSGCVSLAYGLHGILRGSDCALTDVSCSPDLGASEPWVFAGIIVAFISVIAGARLVFPLVFMAVGVGSLITGVQTKSTENGSFLGHFSLVFGGSFIVVSIIMLAFMLFYRSMRKKTAEETRRLMQTGIPAVATIVSMHDTGVRINENPRVTLRVRVEPTIDMPGYEGEKTVLMLLGQPFHVGQRLPALMYPEDMSRFILVTDVTDPSQVPPRLSELFQSVTAGAPTSDLAGQLAKLDDLRRSGALSDQEFTAAKARLIGH
jgi:hypothetical protein